MPYYKIVFDEKHTYFSYASSAEKVKDFRPKIVIDEDYENLQPLPYSTMTVEEVTVSIVFQLPDVISCKETFKIAKNKGLKAEKATGYCCIQISGKGDWMNEAWLKDYKKLSFSHSL
jgi:hypothetical protein